MSVSEDRNAAPGSAVVVGGGIVGLATAYALARAGVRITLLDAGPADQRASSATAGIIGGSSVVPWADASLWWRLPRIILDRHEPLFMSWPPPKGLLHFARCSWQASHPDAVRASAAGLANLGLKGLTAWQDLLTDLPAAGALFRQNGCLFFYPTPKDRAADVAGNALRCSFGMDLTELTEQEMRNRLPDLHGPVAGGMCVNTAAHVTDPVGLQDMLQQAVADLGGTIFTARATSLETSRGLVTAVSTDTGTHAADIVILTAGTGAAALANGTGLRIPIAPAWGASVTFENPGIALELPLLVLGEGFAATPSAQGLRVSGLLQVGGAGKVKKMQARLVELAQNLFGDFSYSGLRAFAGPRPLMADSLPVLGSDPTYRNLFHNFGHGHWGLTQAAISAQVIANLATGHPVGLDISAYDPERFHSNG